MTALFSFAGFLLIAEYKYRNAELLRESTLQASLISDYIVTPLLFMDRIGAKEVLSKLNDVPRINAAVIYDQNGKEFTHHLVNSKERAFAQQIDISSKSSKYIDDEIIITMPIVHNETHYGAIVIHVSRKDITTQLLMYTAFLFLIVIILTLLSLFVIFKIQNYITTPIIDLAKTAQEISLSENYTLRAQKIYDDEVGNLYDDFNSMLEKIEQNARERDEAEAISRTYQAHLERITNELEERVKDRTIALQESINQLENTQSQLIESEKMSALGNLVAGVAHEVNTPLGISITAASIFKNEIMSIQERLKENKLTKSALHDFIETITEADDILIKNLDRAALLIKNFKKISVDQSSEDIRDFELNTYMKEILTTFKSELRHRPVTLEIKFKDEAISMHSYPGAIAQIIINMLQNTLVHAFDDKQEGKILIQTQKHDDKVRIIFSDDGKGLDKSIADKIFEPFITTKRNQGGTGLGLNITYNLVTQQLGGTIHIDGEHKKGTSFITEIPCELTSVSNQESAEV
jgi:signal transduction histidine kinase